MTIDMGPYDQYLLALIVVVGTYAAVVAVLWTTQRSRYAPAIKTFHGIAQNFLTVINVIFALNLAFLANDTWNARDRALNAVFQEAGNLRSLVDLAVDLPDPIRSEVTEAVGRYAALTVGDEWRRLGRRQSSEAVSAQLDALVALLSTNRVAHAVNSSAHALMLRQAIEIRSTRDLRIALSRTHVNPLKWLGMVFLGFLTMISIAMVHVDQPRAQFLSVLLFATAAAPTAAIILIHGNPFQHPLAVSPTPIATVLDATAAAGR
jgi:hypothetical protein